MNDYEKSPLLRVQDNKKKIQDLGLKRIADSLTSLVDSQKKKKKKVQPTYINDARDELYIPDNDNDSEEDNQEVDTNIIISKKQNRPQYIASQKMNKIANLAKKNRVTASRASHKFPPYSNEAKKNQRGSKITMDELISKVRREKVPSKEKIWEYVLEKYNVSEAAKTWVLKSIGQSYKLFERTRKRTEGHSYVDTYDDTSMKIEQMKNYKPIEDGNATVDPFLAP
ncbi:hypothetical protein L1987_44683 [Smallanthus sonchifolius]|uniref:Uncharacterized protein n=1 Tax=Smallanthus sonchifolius TaxID=185202 RepID=A0ACB9GQW0_9ASTR|nr:hypothetical protein L1987_44683 [Smallanthus sonchifolius]